MRILYDLTYIHGNLQSGIAKYSYRMLQGLKDLGLDNQFILLINKADYSNICKNIPNYSNIVLYDNSKRIPYKDSFGKIWLWRKKVDSIDCDAVIIPVQVVYSILLRKKKNVVVFHDLQELKINNCIWKMIYFYSYKRILSNANAIISISNFVKNDITLTYPSIRKSKINVIYNSILLSEKSIFYNTGSCNYILYVNSLLHHKNILTLIKAFNNIKNEINHNLVIVGHTTLYYSRVIEPIIIKERLSDRIIHIDVSVTESELVYIYKHASLFVNPSLMEGFGFTPIEAGICMTPVISSKSTSLFETTQGLLKYYNDSLNDNELGMKIIEVLNNPPQKQELETIKERFIGSYDYMKQSLKFYNLIINNFSDER